MRARARQVIGDGRVLEVHLSAPLDVCRARDRTGLYARADAGEIKAFPGISAAYEAPVAPDLVLPTHEQGIDACVAALVELLRSRGAIA